MIAIAVREGRSDDPIRPSPSMGWWCVVMWALFTARAVKSTATGFHVQDMKVKPATRCSPSVYRLALVFAAGISVSACSQDGARNRSAEAPAALPGQPAGAAPGAVTSQSPAPDAPPTRWVELIGEYGPDDDVWMVLEDDARLHLRQGESADPLWRSRHRMSFSAVARVTARQGACCSLGGEMAARPASRWVGLTSRGGRSAR